MKYLFLVSGGRNGSLFFQSLLDGHPEVLQFPGIFLLDEFLDKIQLTGNSRMPDSEVVAKMFIDSYPEFFDSRLNPLHRMGALGRDRNEHLEVSTSKFLELYVSAAGRENSSLVSIVDNLHAAWSLAAGENLGEKKVTLIHIHHALRIERVQRFIKGLEFRVVFMERDILPSLASEYNGWRRYEQTYSGKDLALDSYSWMLNRKLLEPIRVAQLDSRAFSILLEELHRNSREVLSEFCKTMKLSFAPSMLVSTFGGKLWWGDQLGEMKNGLNSDFRYTLNQDEFFKWEVELIEGFVFVRRQANGYPRLNVVRRSCVYFLLPGKIEIENLIQKLKNVGSVSGLKSLLRDALLFPKILARRFEILLNVTKSKMLIRPLVRYGGNS